VTVLFPAVRIVFIYNAHSTEIPTNLEFDIVSTIKSTIMAEKQSSANAGHGEKAITRAETGNTATSQSLPFAPHTSSSAKVLEALHADPKIGLSDSEVAGRLQAHGPNRLKPPKRPSVLAIIMRQIGNAMTLVLSESQFDDHFGCRKTPGQIRDTCDAIAD